MGLWRKLLRRRWSKTDRRRVELFLLRRGEAAQAGSVFFTAVLLRLGGRVGGRVKLGGKGVGGKGNAAPRAVDLLRELVVVVLPHLATSLPIVFLYLSRV